jgi:hypothetical protein
MGLTVAEIVAALGVSRPTVNVRLRANGVLDSRLVTVLRYSGRKPVDGYAPTRAHLASLVKSLRVALSALRLVRAA